MKILLSAAALTAIGLFGLSLTSRAAPPGSGFRSGGLHRGYPGHSSGPAFNQSRGFSVGRFHDGFVGHDRTLKMILYSPLLTDI